MVISLYMYMVGDIYKLCEYFCFILIFLYSSLPQQKEKKHTSSQVSN